MVLTFESIDQILKSDYSKESYRAVISCGPVYYAIQGDSNFLVRKLPVLCSPAVLVVFKTISCIKLMFLFILLRLRKGYKSVTLI